MFSISVRLAQVAAVRPNSCRTTTTITGQGEYLRVRANPLLPTQSLMERLADFHTGTLRPPLTGKNVTVSREVFEAHAKVLAGYTEVRESVIGIGHLMSIWILGTVGGAIAWFIAHCHAPSGTPPFQPGGCDPGD
jgi:hypothetical protein